MKAVFFLITTLVTTPLFLAVAPIAQAQIAINEVFPAPNMGGEWIELYNLSNQEIDLNNWLLEDQLSSPSIISHIENQILPAQSFLTIDLSSAKLNNSADGVILKNSAAEIVDQMNYQGSESGLSWAKNSSGIFELAQPTKNTPNEPLISSSRQGDTSFHHFISISEFLACPTAGEKEWIMLHNADNQPHSISNWKIRDNSNQTRQINATLMANEHQVILWSGSLLNNTGDEFVLENELGESWQNIKYDACRSNGSFKKNGEQWTEVLTTTITKPVVDGKVQKTNAAPPNDSSPLPATILIPPNPPVSLLSTQQLALTHDSKKYSNQNKLKNITTKNLPRESLLSVILGGSWLLFSSSWKMHEKISQHRSNT